MRRGFPPRIVVVTWTVMQERTAVVRVIKDRWLTVTPLREVNAMVVATVQNDGKRHGPRVMQSQ